MKDGVGIINAARGGVLMKLNYFMLLDSGKVSFAGLDTFENEPKPEIKLLMHPSISLTPHIGAATNEAQDRIGLELADQISRYFKLDMLKKLNEKWGISTPFQVVIVFIVFGVTGSVAAKISGPITIYFTN